MGHIFIVVLGCPFVTATFAFYSLKQATWYRECEQHDSLRKTGSGRTGRTAHRRFRHNDVKRPVGKGGEGEGGPPLDKEREQ